MNRYLVRALVAVLTFCIGVAIGYRPHEAIYKVKHRCHEDAAFLLDRRYDADSQSMKLMTIENLPTDPLKIRYSFTKVNPGNPAKKLVEFAVENDTGREISGYAVGYRSGWPSNPNNSGGVKSVYNSENFVPFLSINCDADKQLTVWVSSVNFKDGSRWTNPLHDY